LVTFTIPINSSDMFFLYKGRRISYNDSGKGKAIVLIHGYLETSGVWDSFARRLSEKFRVISVDLPGHGLSESFGTGITMEFMAGLVKDLIDSAGIKKVFLTGHSLGGYVALAFMELFPDSLSGYCLFHSQPFPDTPESAEKRTREIYLVREGKKEVFYPESITRMYASSNLEKFSQAVQRSKAIAEGLGDEGIIAVLNGMMKRPSRLSAMEEGRVPCLWILGALDNYIPCVAIQERVRLPVNARVVVLEHSGHMGFIEEEDLSVSALNDFVTTLY
jgi:pimeloyl-ACP methyl ester carboxylesterase